MDWFPQNTPLVSVVFEGGAKSDAAWVMDIVPSRWSCTTSLEDAVLSFAARWVSYEPHRIPAQWNIQAETDMIAHGYRNEDFSFGPGGLSIHTGAPVPGALRLRILTDGDSPDDAPVVVLPDGQTYPLAAFCSTNRHWFGTKIGGAGIQYLASSLKAKANPSTEEALDGDIAAFYLGMAEAFVASPHAQTLTTSAFQYGIVFASVAAACLRHMAVCTRSGRDAVRHIAQNNKSHSTNIFLGWGIRPNAGWNATHWALGTTFDALKARCSNTLAMDAGRAAGAVFFGLQGSIIDNASAIIADDETAASAHERMRNKALRTQVEKAALGAFATAPDRLKPMAARKARKIAGL